MRWELVHRKTVFVLFYHYHSIVSYYRRLLEIPCKIVTEDGD